MDATPNLALPFILAAQSQKHVTHNEAIRALDALVQLMVLDKDLATPPGLPADGARYIVAASATGAWAGQTGKIAAWQDGAWAFYAPNEGWLAWVADENAIYAYDGAAWTLSGGVTDHGALTGLADDDHLQYLTNARGDARYTPLNPTTLGINATADTTNRLAVSSAAALFNHAGNGHQVKVNKNAAADTASFLFQTGFSGRAEIGTTGDDDFHFKVSSTGTTFTDAIKITGATGNVRLLNLDFPSGAVVNWNSGDVTLTHAANTLAFAGASLGYTFDAPVGAGTASPDRRLHSEVDDASNNTVTYAARLTHTTSGTAAAGIGVGLEFEAETAAGNNRVGAAIEAIATTATDAAEKFALLFKTMTGGAAAAERVRIDDAGQLGIGLVPSAALVHVAAGTASTAPLKLSSGTSLTTPAAGAVEYDGKTFYATAVASARQVVLAEQLSVLTADRTGSNSTSAQAIFNASEDEITLAASTTYEFEAVYYITRSSGTNAHTTAVLFGGTATFTSIDYLATVSNPTGNVLSAPQDIMGSAASAVTVTASNSSATENLRIKLRGTLRINAGGTVIPQFQYSSNPGGAPTIKRNSFFRCWSVGSDTVAAVGNWG